MVEPPTPNPKAADTPPPWRRPPVLVAAAAVVAVLAVAAQSTLAIAGVAGAIVAGGLAIAAVGLIIAAAWRRGADAARDPLASLMREASEAATEAQFITDAEARLVHANAAFRRLLGADGADADLPLSALAGLFAADQEAARTIDRLVSGAASGVSGQAELALGPAGEATEWRRITAAPGPEGYILWRAEDVTARRQVETVRRREEERLADFLDHLPAGFFSVDEEGRILYANHTFNQWLGVGADDLRGDGVRFADFVVDRHDTDPDEAGDGAVGAHGRVRLLAPDGTTFAAYLLQSEQLGSLGDFAYSRSIVLRARDLPNADDEGSAAQARRLHWLFEEVPVGIALLDLDGTVDEANRAFLKLFGLHREAVVGRPISDRIAPGDRDDVAAQLSKVVMGTMPAAHLEVRMPVSPERELITSLFASRMEDTDGEVSGLVLHFIDTTEQKHLEVQFAQSQKMQAVGQLAGGVAHDFNNLLTAMIGFSDLLLERHGPEDPSFADIMQIKQNTNRATNLVRQLLAFSRKQTLQSIDVDPTAALSDMSNLLRRLIGETIELDMEHGRNLGAIRVDPGQFDQVIINLAVNARDAMPGGGTLTIRTSTVRTDVPIERGLELMPAGDFVLIEVVDTGSGIAKESIGRIFEPFFSTKEKGAGTGLGLSTVYGIVRQTDGFIFVDSARGAGTTFSVYLPRYETMAGDGKTGAVDVTAEPAVEADLTGAGTVLLVEDESAVRMFGARVLRNKGYNVLEADNGESALDVINGHDAPIDLIISDVVMPGMDGHTLARLVRQELTDIKIILMSGYAEDVVPGQIDQDSTIHFLPKPFSLKDLARTVKEVMET